MTSETQDVCSFTHTNPHSFMVCCLLQETNLPAVKLLHFTYEMRRFYSGDCKRYSPLDVTLHCLAEICPPLEGKCCSLETSENFHHTARLLILQYGTLLLLCIVTQNDLSV
jgi:hypothetical protein